MDAAVCTFYFSSACFVPLAGSSVGIACMLLVSFKTDGWWLGCGERAYICVPLSERDVWVGASPSPLSPVLIQPPYQLQPVCPMTALPRPGYCYLLSLARHAASVTASIQHRGRSLLALLSFVPITRSSTTRFLFERVWEIMKLKTLCFPTHHLFTGNLSCVCSLKTLP